MREQVVAECGHLTSNPVWIGHEDVPFHVGFAVCAQCVAKPEVRATFEGAYPEQIAERRQAYQGVSKRERQKIGARVVQRELSREAVAGYAQRQLFGKSRTHFG